MRFDPKFFQKFDFSRDVIAQYFRNAQRDLKIAQTDAYTEVRFSYTYQALVKAGIELIVHEGGVKVRSIPGHHIKVIDVMAQLLKNDEIKIVGHAMRKKRNMDLYEGGELVSEKEVEDYLRFVEGIVFEIKKKIE